MGEVVYLFGKTADGSAAEQPRARKPAAGSRTKSEPRKLAGTARRPDSSRPRPPDGAPTAPAAAASAEAAFFFELGCPITYIAAERIERALGELAWVPTARLESERGRDPIEVAHLLAFATREATTLRLPLVVPEGFGGEPVAAWRAAAYASGQGEGTRFALAASRLAFCGGFDLGERSVLAEAARASGLSTRDCLDAADDPRWDAQLCATARGLAARGLLSTPAIRLGDRWFSGHDAVRQACSFSAVLATRGAAWA